MSFLVVSWRSVTRGRVILQLRRSRSSVSSCIILGNLAGVVLRSLSLVVAWSREILRFLGVVNWSLSVVFRFNVVRRSSRCVVSRGNIILGRLSRVARGIVLRCLGGVLLGSLGVVGYGSIRSRVVLRCLSGVLLGSLGALGQHT